MQENQLGTIIVDCTVQFHRALVSGLLETVYKVTLARLLERQGIVRRSREGKRMRKDGSVEVDKRDACPT